MKLKVSGARIKDCDIYKCEFYEVQAHKRSCFFCKCCMDIFFDYTNGPYMFFCNKEIDQTQDTFINGCTEFESDGAEEN